MTGTIDSGGEKKADIFLDRRLIVRRIGIVQRISTEPIALDRTILRERFQFKSTGTACRVRVIKCI